MKVDHQRTHDGLLLQVKLVTDHVGHRVPTGFIDRHLLLVVEPLDAQGRVLDPIGGPRLPSAAGDLADRPGMLFAKRLVDPEGNSPVPFWRAGVTVDDNRLEPGSERSVEFQLPTEVVRIRIRLVFRPFWQATAVAKQWPDDSVDVIEQVVGVP
jgi:hypothetical protein